MRAGRIRHGNHEAIARIIDLGANAYVVKPLNLKQLASLVSCIDMFWLTLAVGATPKGAN